MIWLFFIIEIAVAAVIFFIFTAVFLSIFTNAPFVPTGRRDLEKILDIADLKFGENFYDLGAGDGRLIIAAAKRGIKSVGFERVFSLVLWSRFLIYLRGLSGQAVIKKTNFLKENLSSADVIFCYLMPKVMEQLKPKLENELKSGSRVISRAFAIPGWKPQAVYRFSKTAPPVYLYDIM